MAAQDAKQQAEEQRSLSQRAQEEAQRAQGSIARLQQQVAEASSAAAAWDAERASLESAAAAAGEMASAEEIQRKVQAGIAGEQPYSQTACLLRRSCSKRALLRSQDIRARLCLFTGNSTFLR